MYQGSIAPVEQDKGKVGQESCHDIAIKEENAVKIFRNRFTLPEDKACGVGLGNFDGLHRGHMALINTLINECQLNDLHSVVYTFMKHPEHILRKKLYTPLIMTTDHKAKVLEKTGLESLCFQEFDEEFSRMSPESFVEDILVRKMRAKLVVVGFNFHFGYMGKGDTDLLRQMGNQLGFRLVMIPPVKVREEIVSSTIIRQYIMKGKMEKAFELLGRHFSVPGKVISGTQVGRTLGFPTANMIPERCLVMPAIGVYITRTMYQGKWYNSVTNVGHRPTLNYDTKVTLETHMTGFDGQLYGQDIEVFFLKKLRDEKRFSNRDELIHQIQLDLLQAEKFRNT